MFSFLRNISKDEIVKGWLTLLTGNLVRMVLAVLVSILVVRKLGPERFGIFALISATVAIFYTISDFGLCSAATKFIAQTVKSSLRVAQQIAFSFFWLKMLIAVVICVVAILLADMLCRIFFYRPEISSILQLGFLALISMALSSTVTTFLQAIKKFRTLTAMQILNPLLSLIVFILLIRFNLLSLQSVIIVGIVVPGFIFFIAAYRLKESGFPLMFKSPDFKISIKNESVRKLTNFSKWLWLSAIFSILVAQLDLILVNRFTTSVLVGVYALALNISFRLDVVNQSLYTVLLPVVSGLTNRKEFIRYLYQSLKKTLPFVVLLTLTGPFLKPLIILFYGHEYAASVPVLYILILVVLFDLVTTPIILLAFPMNQSKLLAASDVLRVVVLIISSLFLIPKFGIIGAAWSKLMAKIAGATLTASVIFLQLSRLRFGKVKEDTLEACQNADLFRKG
ncbi:MAG: flippase [bacterium]